VKIVLLLLVRWLCVIAVSFSAAFATMHFGRRTTWYKDHLYQQLLSGDDGQRLHAASVLAQVGGEPYLLNALKAEQPEVNAMARRALEHLWFSSAGNEAYRLMESAYESAEKKEFEEALRMLDQITASYPNYAEAWNRRAAVLWQLGKYKESMSDCERSLQLNPNHYGASQGIGICHLQMGDVAEACRALRVALKIAPHDETTLRSLRKCEELLRTYQPSDRSSRSSRLL
jgi:tetratricopeptide (TPR) repeat protein